MLSAFERHSQEDNGMFFMSAEFQTVVSALNEGFLKTVQLFFLTLIGALPLGLVISFGSMSRFTPLRWLTRTVVWIIRGTPLVLQILIIYYVPPLMKLFTWGGGETGRFTAVTAAFIINYAFYFSEIYRGGIQGVPAGQQEAGQVLGMTKSQIFFRVTLLQMIKRIVPPMSNEIITLVKDTSLARVIALQEVIWMGESFMKGNRGYAGLIWPLFFTAVYYLAFSGIVTINDLVEQLVGELVDEEPEEDLEIERINGGIWKIRGSAPLDEVSKAIGIEIESENYDTLNGLIIEALGRIPKDGTQFEVDTAGLRIRVMDVQDHQVTSAIVSILPPSEAATKENEAAAAEN